MKCVIGGAGFLGSHLVDYLIERGDEVLVLDNLISGKEKNIHPKANFIWFDINGDVEELTQLFKRYQVDDVYNYAAEPYIPECFERPKHFFMVNAVAVLNVITACERVGARLLQVSSAEIYGDMKGKISEDATVQPHSTYGVSKVAADGLVQVRHRESGIHAIAMRQFNCVGERESHEYVIPEIISQLDKSNTVHLGNNTWRDFQYAGDAVRMAVELLEKGKPGEVYNMGSEETIRIYDLAGLIGRLMGHEEINVITDASRFRPWDIEHLQSDNTKLYSVIEFRPTVNLEEALRRTINSFNANGHKWDF